MADDSSKIEKWTDTAAYATASAMLVSATGIPLPPIVLKNAMTAVSAMVAGAGRVPLAWFEARARRISDDAEALSIVTKASAVATAKRFKDGTELGDRAADFWANRVLGEQRNREAIVEIALAETIRSRESSDSDADKELDPDWLDMFSRHAETKSNADMRTYFGRVLAGEIRKPGSFSPTAIEVLSRLSADDAERFQRFCSAALAFRIDDEIGHVLLAEPLGDPGSNALAQVGFSYNDLAVLREAGLIRHDMNAAVNFGPKALAGRVLRIGSRPVALTFIDANEVVPQPIRPISGEMRALFFSGAGEELLRIVDAGESVEYLARFFAWAGKNGMRQP